MPWRSGAGRALLFGLSPPQPMKTTVILRWIAVLPSAALSGLIALFVVNLFSNLLNWFWLDTVHSFGAQFSNSMVCGMGMGGAFVQGGVYAAPYFKQKTAFWLCLIGIFALLPVGWIAVSDVIAHGWKSGGGWTAITLVFAAFTLWVAGTIHRSEEQQKFTSMLGIQ